jgi:hypothetical protein
MALAETMRRLTSAVSIVVLAPLRLVEAALEVVLGEPPTREPITRERAKYDLDFEKKVKEGRDEAGRPTGGS